MYAGTVIAEFLVISGIIPFASDIYKYFVAFHSAMVISTLWCLFLNGFVPYQFIEDGTAMSLWLLRISTLVVFAGSYFISIGTFLNIIGMTAAAPSALWTIYFVFSAAFILIYFGFQVFLVATTLEDRTPIVDIVLALVFMAGAQVIAFVFSSPLCESVKHYLDGMFFSTILTLLSVMMVYKYWDSITKEDLEFAVGCKNNTWEIADPLLSDHAMASMVGKDYGSRY